jgi:hypothetical protein
LEEEVWIVKLQIPAFERKKPDLGGGKPKFKRLKPSVFSGNWTREEESWIF